jgi:lysyl-tRNA synthetase class 2
MATIDELRNTRIEKRKKLEGAGLNPYPSKSKQDYELAKVVKDFAKLSKSKTKEYSLVGRVLSLRPQGGLIFFHFSDGTEKMQAMLKKGELISDKDFDLLNDTVDMGDYVEVKGKLFLTKRKEKTIQVSSWKMLAKSLLPLPEKWHGLQDIDERFRHRYLDTLMNPEVKERFLTRAKLITEIRKILDDAGYLEVETPALQPLYGGASAMPFMTHHKALDTDLYLRISDELYLKRLLAGGFPKVYEIARDFRNEGIDTTHNPEFTMLEFYESYSDADKQMAFVEKMFKSLAKNLFQKSTISWGGVNIDMKSKFKVVAFYDLIRQHALIPNPESISQNEAGITAQQLGVKVDPSDSLEKILDNIYKKVVRPKLIQPTFIIDYPENYLPLAKKKEGSDGIVEAFQLIIGGVELVKAFSELNDPIDQRARFENQEKNLEKGDKEAQRVDEDFIEAMEHGIPPAGGVGIGIDRLAMLFTDTKNIKEVILFPTLKPRSEQ